MWAERDPAAINFEMKRMWSCHRVEKIHASSCVFTVEFSFFLFLILHPFWKITIKCDAPDSNILLLFSLHLPYLFLSAVMPRFAEQVEVAIEALSTNPPQAFEENEFIDASRLVYDGVRDIRKAVLMIRVCPLSPLQEQKENTHWNS